MNREASSVDRLTNDAPPSSRLQKEERLSTRKANGSSSSTLHSLVQKVQTVSSHGDVHDRIPKTSSGLQFVRTDRVQQRKLREVDFYRNPTVLSRMILFQKYSSAIQRLAKHPEEAQIWVCQKRKSTKEDKDTPYTIRQLPLHAATWNLNRNSKTSVLHQLIEKLVVAFPQSCQEMDHMGQLPLHMAVAHEATPETISFLLMAYPQSLNVRNAQGRLPRELLANSNNNGLQALLDLGVNHWMGAHQQLVRQLHPVFAEPSSLSSEADSNAELKPVDMKQKSDRIEPIAWEQLEERALALEELLTCVNERNFFLTRKLGETLREKEELRRQIDEARDEHLICEIADLKEQNFQLKQTVLQMEGLIRKTVLQIQHEEERDGRKRPRRTHEGIASLESVPEQTMPSTPEGLMERVHKLRHNYETLLTRYDSRLEHINRLETIIDTLTSHVPNQDEETPQGSPSVAASHYGSDWSDLTVSDHKKPRAKKTGVAPVNHWVPPEILMPESDDLSVIFRLAAARESDYWANQPQIGVTHGNSLPWIPPVKVAASSVSVTSQPSDDGSSMPANSMHGSRNSSMYESIVSGGDVCDIEIPALDTSGENPQEDRYAVIEGESQEDWSSSTGKSGMMASTFADSIVSGGFGGGADDKEIEIPVLNMDTTSSTLYESMDQISLSRIGFDER